MSDRVAVVVPCFNDGAHLPEALESVAAQEPCELVIVDDGSTDEATLALLDSLRSAGTNVVTQRNAGPSAARTAGVAATTAPYVHPLDSDDRLAEGALTALADALDTAPDAGAAWGSYRTFGATDCRFPTAPTLDPWRITFLDEIPGTCMVRREVLEAVGGWTTDVGYEDWDLWLKVAGHGAGGVGIPAVTLFYREHASARRFTEDLKAHDRHFQVLRERHRALFSARAANRRASASPQALKLLLPAIDAIPSLPETRKRQLWGMARYLFQPEMSSDCYRGPFERLRAAISPARGQSAL